MCEITQQLLLGLRREFDFELREVDITTDPALLERYGEKIPGLMIDGQVELVAPIRVETARRHRRG